MADCAEPLERPAPIVSIIVPVYNREQYVARAIESALNQTLKEVEVAVVDDGSTDGTPEVLKRYADRVTVIRQENKGVASALNIGIKAARGKYICFLGSDDIVMPNKAEIQAKVLEDSPEIGLCYGAWLRRDRLGSVTRHVSWLSDGRLTTRELVFRLVQKTPFPASSPLIRAHWLCVVGGHDESLRSCVDLDLWWRLAAAGCLFRGVDEVVTLYQAPRPGSISSVKSRLASNGLRVLDKYFSTYGQAPAGMPAKEELYARSWLELAQASLHEGNIEAALGAWARLMDTGSSVFAHRELWASMFSMLSSSFLDFDILPGRHLLNTAHTELGRLIKEKDCFLSDPRSGFRQSQALCFLRVLLTKLAFLRRMGWTARAWLFRAFLAWPGWVRQVGLRAGFPNIFKVIVGRRACLLVKPLERMLKRMRSRVKPMRDGTTVCGYEVFREG